MDLAHALLLIIAGIVGGTISSLVGGAALVTYPALLAIGLPPVTATVCNLVALSPGNLLAALYDRTQLPPLNRSFVGLIIASVLGALAGAIVLLRTRSARSRSWCRCCSASPPCCSPTRVASARSCACAPAIRTRARTAGSTVSG